MTDKTAIARQVRLELVKSVVAVIPPGQLAGVRAIVEPLTDFVMGEQPAAAAMPPMKARRADP